MRSSKKTFVICLQNKGYEVSLEPRKLYQVLPDTEAEKHRQIRVVDESGEDYLFPKSYFATIELPRSLQKAILAAA